MHMLSHVYSLLITGEMSSRIRKRSLTEHKNTSATSAYMKSCAHICMSFRPDVDSVHTLPCEPIWPHGSDTPLFIYIAYVRPSYSPSAACVVSNPALTASKKNPTNPRTISSNYHTYKRTSANSLVLSLPYHLTTL